MAFLEDLWDVVKGMPVSASVGVGTQRTPAQPMSIADILEHSPARKRQREDQLVDLAQSMGVIDTDLAGKFKRREIDPALLPQLGALYDLRQKRSFGDLYPQQLEQAFPEGTTYTAAPRTLTTTPTGPGTFEAVTPATPTDFSQTPTYAQYQGLPSLMRWDKPSAATIAQATTPRLSASDRYIKNLVSVMPAAKGAETALEAMKERERLRQAEAQLRTAPSVLLPTPGASTAPPVTPGAQPPPAALAPSTAATPPPAGTLASQIAAARKVYDTMPNETRQRIDAAVQQASQTYGIPAQTIYGMIARESAFNPQAVSKKGGQGLMQLMPGTATEMGVKDPFNIEQNINGGTKYLKQQLTDYEGDEALALAAYNAGPNNVEDEVPDIPETQRYVKEVPQFAHAWQTPPRVAGPGAPAAAPVGTPTSVAQRPASPMGLHPEDQALYDQYSREIVHLTDAYNAQEHRARVAELYKLGTAPTERAQASAILQQINTRQTEQRKLLTEGRAARRKAEDDAARQAETERKEQQRREEQDRRERLREKAAARREQVVKPTVEQDVTAKRRFQRPYAQLTVAQQNEVNTENQKTKDAAPVKRAQQIAQMRMDIKKEADTRVALNVLEQLSGLAEKVFTNTNSRWQAGKEQFAKWALGDNDAVAYNDLLYVHVIPIIKALTASGRLTNQEINNTMKGLPVLTPIQGLNMHYERPDTLISARQKLRLLRELIEKGMKREDRTYVPPSGTRYTPFALPGETTPQSEVATPTEADIRAGENAANELLRGVGAQ